MFDLFVALGATDEQLDFPILYARPAKAGWRRAPRARRTAAWQPLFDLVTRRVVGMTLPVARDLAASGIRLNTVAPGLIDTPIYGEGRAAEAFKAKLGESVLFPKRLGVPDELASMVVECLTNSYMNAETVRVDGGIRMPRSSRGKRGNALGLSRGDGEQERSTRSAIGKTPRACCKLAVALLRP